jgi:surface antigen
MKPTPSKTRLLTLSASGLLAFSLMQVSVVFAEPRPETGGASLESLGYPLLADSRSDRRVFDNDHPRAKERGRLKPDSGDRDRRRSNDGRRYERRDPKLWREHERERDHRDFRPPRFTRGRMVYDPPRVVVVPRHSHPRDHIILRRPFRYYPRHRHYHWDRDLWGLLAFTAITLSIIDNLNDAQQRQHELALYGATSVPLGETIYWHEGSASGSVTPIQEGTSSAGRYCREFQHEVNIGGKTEVLYGTACRNDDGSWEIVQ